MKSVRDARGKKNPVFLHSRSPLGREPLGRERPFFVMRSIARQQVILTLVHLRMQRVKGRVASKRDGRRAQRGKRKPKAGETPKQDKSNEHKKHLGVLGVGLFWACDLR
jgi:hypothetical protein